MQIKIMRWLVVALLSGIGSCRQVVVIDGAYVNRYSDEYTDVQDTLRVDAENPSATSPGVLSSLPADNQGFSKEDERIVVIERAMSVRFKSAGRKEKYLKDLWIAHYYVRKGLLFVINNGRMIMADSNGRVLRMGNAVYKKK